MGEPTVIFAPGLLCDAAMFEAQVQGLADLADCRVLDHGQAASLTGMAERALAAAPARFALVGHSMGGRMALEVARMAPERLTGLALLDTNFPARPPGPAGEDEARRRMALVELARREGMRAAGLEWARPMVHPSRQTDAALMEAILAMIARKTPDLFEAQQRALIDRPDAGPVLATIACPTLVLCGLQDAWSPPEAHREMARRIPGARLEEIDVCGHMAPMERPQAVTAALRAWLADAVGDFG